MKTYITAGALKEAMGEVEGIPIVMKEYLTFYGNNSELISIKEESIPSFIKAGLIKEVENEDR